MNVQKIKVDELKLSDIINEFSKGRIRIPRFQRNYVWDRPRVVKLLNSIYSEFPIGTFFFWDAPAEYSHLYRNIPELHIPELDNSDTFQFILDGQQRITSLYVAIKGLQLTIQDRRQNEKKIDYSEISFDLDQEKFVIKRPDDTRHVSLTSMLESNHLDLFRSLTNERALAFNKCFQIFSTYPLSVVYVKNQGLENACDIFERINQGGVKLSVFDLVVASTWSNDFDLKEVIAELNKTFEEKSFGALDPEIYLQSLSLLAKGQTTREAQLQLRKEEITGYWDTLVTSLMLAVDYLRDNLGVKIYEFVPYRSIIPMIVYFFASTKKKSLTNKQKDFLDEWFWKCTFSERYNVSTASAMAEDKRLLFDSILQGKDIVIDYPVNVTQETIKQTKMYRNTGVRNGIICLLACMQPRHFKNGGLVSLDKTSLSDFNSSERHHIFPKAFLKKAGKTWNENSIANFCFIPAELNLEILARSPKDYFSKFAKNNPHFKKILTSHVISLDEQGAIWNNNYDEFLTERSLLLLEAIEKKVGKISPLQDQLIKDPNKVINEIEIQFRLHINHHLEEKFGIHYWKTAIPGDTQEMVKERVTKDKNRYPDISIVSGLEKLSFCDLDDYRKIITTHWNLFEDIFVSKGDFERNYVFLSDYRNVIKHTRTPSSIEKKQGEAAIEWFIHKMQTDDTQEYEEE